MVLFFVRDIMESCVDLVVLVMGEKEKAVESVLPKE